MSAISELRDAKAEHEKMRAHLSPEENKDLDDSFNSGSRWLKVGYGVFGLMIVSLFILSM